jgi:hypothetical protein
MELVGKGCLAPLSPSHLPQGGCIFGVPLDNRGQELMAAPEGGVF